MKSALNKISALAGSALFMGALLSIVLSYFAHFYYVTYRDQQLLDRYPIIAEVERLHNQTVDFRMRRRGPRPGTQDVAILTIDEKAIQKYGRWPWPRTLIADVIERLMENGARSISFDIIFSEKQEDVLLSLDELNQKIKKAIPLQASQIESLIAEEKKLKDHDQRLTEVIKKYSDRLIMGAIYDEFEFRPFPYQDTCFLNIAKVKKVYDYWDKEAYLIGVQNAMELALPESWHKVLLNHFNNLRMNVSYEWLIKNPEHDLVKTLTKAGFDPKKQTTVALLTSFIDGDQKKFNELSLGKLDWPHFQSQIPLSERVDWANQMEQSLKDYCLRYLTSKDELTETFKRQWPEISSDYDKFNNLSFEEAKDLIQMMNLENPVHHVDHWLFNLESIRQVTEHTGTFNATQDKDGSVRRAKLFVRNGSLFIPSLAFKTFLVLKDFYPTAELVPNPYENPVESSILTQVFLKDAEDQHVLTIPTDHRGQIPINYAGPQKMFSYLSAAEVLDDDKDYQIEQRILNAQGEWVEETLTVDKKDYLKNKSFVFGATATGVYDLRVTPFEENYPGVETHANLLDNLLRQDYLKTNPKEEVYMPLALLFLGLIFSLIISKLGAVAGLIITLVSVISIYWIDSLFIFSKGTVITVLFPLTTILFLYTFLTFFKYLTEERKKQQLKGTFQKYVSPEIVNEILKDPSKLELGGIKQEMTVFFSDVRGFTTISEKLDPRALSDLLNHYLTPMTEIIFKNSGTLDKYMGDAIMAFFGAPVPSQKHAAQACRAALHQIEKLFELQKIYQEKGLPMIDIGIGLNTGEMSVGNMGSQTVRNYTVMGDSVNLGSRLEGINKEYGTRIIISEFTVKHIEKENFVYREIDWVKVKGKNEPVRIFELIAEGEVSPDKVNHLNHFKSGFELYHKRQWQQAIDAFNLALSYEASDQTSQLYIKRCQGYMNEPPNDQWDGVFTMKTK